MISAKGQRYGRLTVINDYMKESGGRKKHYALCQCDCGEQKEILLSSLKNGNTTSCGCAKVEDVSGQKFGKLTVIGKYPKRINGRFKWECKCDCGNIAFVNGVHLRNRSVKSCGCGQKDHAESMLKDQLETNDLGKTRRGGLMRSPRSDNTSGHQGVSWNSRRHQYEVYISTAEKSKKHIGWFENLEDAVEARKRAEEYYYHPVLDESISGIYQTESDKWRATIFENGKRKGLGLFDTKEEAIQARKEAERIERAKKTARSKRDNPLSSSQKIGRKS